MFHVEHGTRVWLVARARLPWGSGILALGFAKVFRSGSIRIGKLLGIPIYLHSSWFFFVAIMVYALQSQFATSNPSWTESQDVGLGLLTSALFFGCVIIHEMAHSVVARHYRIPVASITLYFFGGMSQISRDPERAFQEFNIAAAGPAATLLLGGGCIVVALLSPGRFDGENGGILAAVALTESWCCLISCRAFRSTADAFCARSSGESRKVIRRLRGLPRAAGK